MNAQELLDLAERVEKLTGPSRVFDCQVWIATNPDTPWIVGLKPGRFPQEPIHGRLADLWDWVTGDNAESLASGLPAPAYTASLDVAMTLANGMALQAEALLVEAMERLRAVHLLRALAARDYAQALAAFVTAAALRARAASLTPERARSN
jgi:hypothetical protein